MNVLIADKLSTETAQRLMALGPNVAVQANLSAEELPAALGDTHILVVRSTQVTKEAISSAPQLALIVRAGAGVNTIDVAEASRRGVYVANCPGKNTAAVAELAIGLLIAADRGIVEATLALRSGKWRKKQFGAARGLKGRTLGILGYGAIGRAVAERAKGLQMRIAAWSRSLTLETAEAEGVEHAATPLELAEMSDAVSVHLALTDDTRGLVGEELFRALRPGAIFINTSRGELINTAALKRAIASRRLRVGLDVFEDEPAGGEGEFADVELAAAVAATPHIGASTDEASEAIAAEVVRIVEIFLKTGRPPGVVNLCARSPATHQLVVRHFNRVGVLAGVLDGLREEGVNVEEMGNTIFAGAEAACCTLHLDQPPSEKLLTRLREDPRILHVLSQPQLLVD
jgi:D-3-phosphoglycerate dehydrogenase / 2-oxoglutarate reductase